MLKTILSIICVLLCLYIRRVSTGKDDQDDELKYVLGIIRHGVRNPGNDQYLDFDKNFPHHDKELTNVGLR